MRITIAAITIRAAPCLGPMSVLLLGFRCRRHRAADLAAVGEGSGGAGRRSSSACGAPATAATAAAPSAAAPSATSSRRAVCTCSANHNLRTQAQSPGEGRTADPTAEGEAQGQCPALLGRYMTASDAEHERCERRKIAV